MMTSLGPRGDRRDLFKLGALAGLGWLGPVGSILAARAEASREPAHSVILLWLAGGPSQLETFDPHPDTRIAGGTRAIGTAARGVRLAEGFDRLAEVINRVSLVRSLVSKEGDHERGTFWTKTGYRPDPSVEFPSIGAICCHELESRSTEIPGTSRSCPASDPRGAAFWGAPSTPFPSTTRRNPSAT